METIKINLPVNGADLTVIKYGLQEYIKKMQRWNGAGDSDLMIADAKRALMKVEAYEAEYEKQLEQGA